MLTDNAPPATAPIQAQTFAYLDLETTGLYQRGRPSPRITEIALVALHRDELLRSVRDMQKRNEFHPFVENGDEATERFFVTPRIVNKILQAINPEMEIPYDASRISGLSSAHLSVMPTFSSFAPTLWAFLDQLPKPVCLIAHNGFKFDFPILKGELLRANCWRPNGEIYCADTITLFRSIDNRWIREHKAEKSAEIPQPLENPQSVLIDPQPQATGEKANGSPVIYRYRFTSINGTPGTEYETSPSRSPGNIKNGGSDETVNSGTSGNRDENQVRRQLFPTVLPSPLAKKKIIDLHSGGPQASGSRMSYTLKAVHQRLFNGSDPLGHHSAEADCLSLLQLSAQYGEEFAVEVDVSMKVVDEIRAPENLV